MRMKCRSSEPVKPATSVEPPGPSSYLPAAARLVARAAACIALAMLSGGCIQMASAWAVMSGGETIEPEFKFTQGPLLIFIDDIDTLVTEPRSIRELHATLAENFLYFKINHRIIPFEEWQRLKQSDPDYDDLKIRQIGDKLGAEQILYMRVTRFALQSDPGSDVFHGEFAVNVKVLSTEQKRDIRLWPQQESGKKVTAGTKPEPTDGDRTSSDVARELSMKLGQEVAKLFYEHKSLDR